jgi:hypothetical protein
MFRWLSHAFSADSAYRLHVLSVGRLFTQHGTWKPSMVSHACVAVLRLANESSKATWSGPFGPQFHCTCQHQHVLVQLQCCHFAHGVRCICLNSLHTRLQDQPQLL